MKPQAPPTEKQGDLFKRELTGLIDKRHPLVRLSDVINWERMEDAFGLTYCDNNGRPGINTRLMVSLHYLKYTYNLSDEAVVDGWVENPYWQYLSGMQWFEHHRPIDPSSMTRWRKRIGQSGAEELLKETMETGLRVKAIKPTELKRVNVDTTVQPKAIRYPTDARLYDRARERLVKAAQVREIPLRQSYSRVGKQELLKQSRYSHAKQLNRAKKSTRKLRTYLGRVIRDIDRKQGPNEDKELRKDLAVSRRIYEQKRRDKNKVYSVHEPSVSCISKGKAHKRYEFGSKVSVATTSRGGWVLGCLSFEGCPYDGHTLLASLNQVTQLAKEPEHVFVDQGYRGHDYKGDINVHVDKKRRGRTRRCLWRWMKRRAAIEPTIGHMKQEHRMDRNRLKDIEGDRFNAILSAAGMNFSKLLNHTKLFWLWIQQVLFSSLCPLRLRTSL